MDRTPTTVVRILLDTFSEYRLHLAILAALGIVGALLDAVSINAIVPLLSFLIGGGQPTDMVSRAIEGLFSFVGVPYKFRFLLGFVALLVISRTGFLAIFTSIRSRVTASFLAREIGALLSGTLTTTWGFIVGQRAGYLQNTIFWDAKRTTNLLDSLVQVIQSSTGALIYLLVAVNISPLITLITLGVGVVLMFVLKPLAARTRHLGGETADAEKQLTHRISEYLQGFKTVKASAVAGAVVKASQAEIARLRDATQRASVVKKLGSVLLQPASFLFIMGLFAISYASASFNLASFAATIYLVQKIFVYLESTQTAFYTSIELIPFAQNISAFKREIAKHREKDSGGSPFVFKKAIQLSDVSLSYDDTRTTLSHISFSIPRGGMVALVGPSGGGKTSIADIILRLFRPTEGTLLLDGAPADRVRLSDWRRAIGYVSQDAFLMHTTVRDNIRFFDEAISDGDIERAAKQAHIYETIQRLPQGFDTILGDRGATLSGGERQRLALARALSRKPQVLVLDEVTSALDSELERQIREVIDELRGQITLVVIAHRISTVLDADEILVVENGRISEKGAPQTMLADADSYLSRIRALQQGNVG